MRHQGNRRLKGNQVSDLEQYSVGRGLTPRDSRRTGRAISSSHAGGLVRVSGIDTETDVAMAKTDAVTAATGQAMAAVVRVAQAQRQLEQLVPEAAGRLAMLAEDHVLTLVEVQAQLRNRLRRQ